MPAVERAEGLIRAVVAADRVGKGAEEGEGQSQDEEEDPADTLKREDGGRTREEGRTLIRMKGKRRSLFSRNAPNSSTEE